MENTVSYKIKIKGYNGIFQDTLDIYHPTVSVVFRQAKFITAISQHPTTLVRDTLFERS